MPHFCSVCPDPVLEAVDSEQHDDVVHSGVVVNFYIRQVNGVKLADILFYLRFRPSVRAHSYLDPNISKTV